MTDSDQFRIEHDTMGEVRVPVNALWRAQTQRAVENFPISGRPLERTQIRAMGLLKAACAQVNKDLGLLDAEKADAIVAAATEIADGKHDGEFPIDVFQTGSGTSSNMNANEVIASIAKNNGVEVHPNDHVNMSQSSNDTFPTATHVAATEAAVTDLIPALQYLHEALAAKATEWKTVVKSGRTHLMDAVPVTLGQEFGGYARQIEAGIERVQSVLPRLGELPIGGTAVGTGLNAPDGFGPQVVAELVKSTGVDALTPAKDSFEAQAARDGLVEASGALRTIAVSLTKIANDIRWMGSGPLTGLGEIRLPDLQPGSSIMPGKVNPVLPEAATQVAAQIVGNDAAIAWGGAAPRDGRVVADDLRRDLRRGLRQHRVDLARHDRAARLQVGQTDLAESGERARSHPADVVGDLGQRDRDGAQGARRLDEAVACGLGLERVLRRGQRVDTRRLHQLGHHLRAEAVGGVEAGSDGGATDGQFAEAGEDRLHALDAGLDLAGVAAELLAEGDRDGIHEVGATGLDDGLPLGGLRRERLVEVLQRRDEIGDRGLGGGDVRGRREGVVGRLRHVDVVVGVDLDAVVLGDARDDLVGVHVGAGARAGLEHVDGEFPVVLAVGDLGRGGHDGVGLLRVEQPEVLVDLRARGLEQTHRTDLRPFEGTSRDGEVLDGALGLGTPECIHGNADLAHGVVLDAELVGISHEPLPRRLRVGCGTAADRIRRTERRRNRRRSRRTSTPGACPGGGRRRSCARCRTSIA